MGGDTAATTKKRKAAEGGRKTRAGARDFQPQKSTKRGHVEGRKRKGKKKKKKRVLRSGGKERLMNSLT